jgi:nucleoside 2-deoxyribosyltransferase
MKKIYIGCSLTHSTEEYKQNINKLKDILREKYEILDFIGLVDGTNQDVYEWDSKCVKSCDLFVMESTYPSTGLGMEFGIAMYENKPILAIAQSDAKVTRMLLGVTYPKFEFHRYDDILSVVELINKAI